MCLLLKLRGLGDSGVQVKLHLKRICVSTYVELGDIKVTRGPRFYFVRSDMQDWAPTQSPGNTHALLSNFFSFFFWLCWVSTELSNCGAQA